MSADKLPSNPKLFTLYRERLVAGGPMEVVVNCELRLFDLYAATAPPVTDQWMHDSRRDGHHDTDSIAAWNSLYALAMLRERERVLGGDDGDA